MTPAKRKRRDEEDEELLLSIGMMQVFLLLLCLMASLIDVRAPPLPQQRLDWTTMVHNCTILYRLDRRVERVKARVCGSKRA